VNYKSIVSRWWNGSFQALYRVPELEMIGVNIGQAVEMDLAGWIK